MKKESNPEDEMLEEYDFSSGIRGKYAARYQQGSNVVVLDPDVAEVFHDAKSVNHALRALVEIIQHQSEETPSV